MRRFSFVLLPAFFIFAVGSEATVPQDPELKVQPSSLEMKVGQKAKLTASLVDGNGNKIKADLVFFSSRRRSLRVDSSGNVTAIRPGKFKITVRASRKGAKRISATVEVTVAWPALQKVEFLNPVKKLYEGTTHSLRTRVLDESKNVRNKVKVKLTSSAPEIASLDEFGNLTANKVGRFTLVARAEGIESKMDCRVVKNPVVSVDVSCETKTCRTGDVLTFKAVARDKNGKVVADAPIHFSFQVRPDDNLGPGSTGQIEQDGRFVAEKPGLYTVVATCGRLAGRTAVRATPRGVQSRIVVIGRGKVMDVHTSDLWVWEGADGRDYAVTGTWGANGETYFWDVTDPSKIKKIATIKVDARTVNDVKVSKDGKICVISREGASNRRNGIVIIDVKDPSKPKIISTFDENLTGGVHNLFIDNGYVYALSAGRRYDVISIKNPKKPHRVGSFELKEPGHSIHDVWIENGLAYSSNWRHGVQIVDVGNGVAGGTPEKPVRVGHYAYPSGRNHAAFPYKDTKTGKFYVVAGDEAFPYGLHVKDKPNNPRGYFHFIDFTDMKNPREVARYEVPEAGSHNLWVEGDILYAAYYNGGLRVVDISGDLMGNLYDQGREIAWFIPTHHKGKIPNAPMVWGPQPFKGHIYFADWNTGLWAVKLRPRKKVRGR